jgi:hypothetical protein
MMATLVLANLCIGAAAGLRFRVFVLFPLTFLCLVVVTTWGLAHNQSSWSIIVTSFAGSACLQLGYLMGTSLLIVASQRSRPQHTQPVRRFAS